SFAIACTPCIGPVLGAIILLASRSATWDQGAYLLLAYSAGLAVPFLIAGYAMSYVTVGLRKYGRFLPVLEVGAGAILVLIGVLIFLIEFTSLIQHFNLITVLNAE